MTDAQARVTAAGSSPDVRQTWPFRASNAPFCDKNATLKQNHAQTETSRRSSVSVDLATV